MPFPKSDLPEEFDADGLHWISVGLINVRYGLSKSAAVGAAARKRIRMRKRQVGRRIFYFFCEADCIEYIRVYESFTDDDGNVFLRDDIAADRVGVTTDAIRKWARFRCPMLPNRRKLSACYRSMRSRGSARWKRLFVSEEDISLILKAINDRWTYHDGREEWISAALARLRYGFDVHTLMRWRRNGCPSIGGVKLRSVTTDRRRMRTVPSLGGRFGKSPSIYYAEKDLNKIRQALEDAARPLLRGDLVTVDEASGLLKVHRNTIHQWIREGCVWLGGSRLRVKRVLLSGQSGTRLYFRTLIHIRDIERIRNARREYRYPRDDLMRSGKKAKNQDGRPENNKNRKKELENKKLAKLFVGTVPENTDIRDLVLLLDANKGSDKSDRQVSIEFTKGDEQKAKSLMSRIHRYKRNGRLRL